MTSLLCLLLKQQATNHLTFYWLHCTILPMSEFLERFKEHVTTRITGEEQARLEKPQEDEAVLWHKRVQKLKIELQSKTAEIIRGNAYEAAAALGQLGLWPWLELNAGSYMLPKKRWQRSRSATILAPVWPVCLLENQVVTFESGKEGSDSHIVQVWAGLDEKGDLHKFRARRDFGEVTTDELVPPFSVYDAAVDKQLALHRWQQALLSIPVIPRPLNADGFVVISSTNGVDLSMLFSRPSSS